MKSLMRSIACLTALWILSCSAVFAQQVFEDQLEASERHQEWVKIDRGDRTLHAFVVYPEISEKAATVVVIHENRGLNVWVRTVADRLAEAGYIAIAPDLLSGHGPDGGKTSDFATSDDARSAIYDLDPDEVTADLRATADYVRTLPAANGEVSVGGFCWGGSQSFRFASNYEDLGAAFVFYGRAPGAEDLSRIEAPVYGFYGGSDERVNATIPATDSVMVALKKSYEPIIYDGAGHGFMRRGVSDAPSVPDAEAADMAWTRWLELLDG